MLSDHKREEKEEQEEKEEGRVSGQSREQEERQRTNLSESACLWSDKGPPKDRSPHARQGELSLWQMMRCLGDVSLSTEGEEEKGHSNETSPTDG
jgi:hypothetical protein